MNKRLLAPLIASALVLSSTSCGDENAKPPKPTETRVHEVVKRFAYLTFEHGARLPHIGKDDKGYKVLEKIDMQDLIYPNGKGEDNLPVLTERSALRVRTQVTLHGESARISNDEACDVIKVEEDVRSVAVVSLGEDEEAYAYWPERHFIRVCFGKDHEPNSIILDPNPPSQ